MRGSAARTSAHARSASSSKSSPSAGRHCQPVTPSPSTGIDRRLGSSRRRLAWCSVVVASHTPLSSGRLHAVTKHEHDLVVHVDRETTEHRVRHGVERRERVEHERVGGRLLRLGPEQELGGWRAPHARRIADGRSDSRGARLSPPLTSRPTPRDRLARDRHPPSVPGRVRDEQPQSLLHEGGGVPAHRPRPRTPSVPATRAMRRSASSRTRTSTANASPTRRRSSPGASACSATLSMRGDRQRRSRVVIS
jgi:hypothetical protein